MAEQPYLAHLSIPQVSPWQGHKAARLGTMVEVCTVHLPHVPAWNVLHPWSEGYQEFQPHSISKK
jgi:hypothetical protein